jgi:hypothetical protein
MNGLLRNLCNKAHGLHNIFISANKKKDFLGGAKKRLRLLGQKATE